MDLTHLRYFVTIVQSGSLTAAARVLRVSQPALSVAVHNLEESLGTTLLNRARSGVSPTRTGEELVRHAAEIFAQIERAEQDIRGIERDDMGRFTIGCHESLGAYFLPGFMKSFMEEAPLIELSLKSATSAAVQAAVVSREVHFGLVVNPSPHPDLVPVDLFGDAMDLFVRAAPQDHGAGEVEPAVPHDSPSLEAARERIRKSPLIYAQRVNQCQELLRRLAAESVAPARLLTCGDLELVKSLALADLGVAMLPRRVAAYGQPGRLRRLHQSLPSFPDRIFLLYRADLHRTRAAMRLKDALVRYGQLLEGASPATKRS